eukprot:TRINITY_DN2641_c0_g1_i1.p1 TRINITY_DN2641_c0_g1~~TRINITY_DN2641_c0_g1_i1.p1  ORF type:complete len:459 (-),score=157.84 TRINITY_DN2641_c0_g1_i1:280-1656(-)
MVDRPPVTTGPPLEEDAVPVRSGLMPSMSPAARHFADRKAPVEASPVTSSKDRSIVLKRPRKESVPQSPRRLRPPPPSPPKKTTRIVVLCGKKDDNCENIQLRGATPNTLCDNVIQSDAAVALWIEQTARHVEAKALKPRCAAALRQSAPDLDRCSAIHVLETEQFLKDHDFREYQKLFADLSKYADKLVPSLETMSLIMSKVDYIEILKANDIPHVPTHVVKRPCPTAPWTGSVKAMMEWVTGRGHVKVVTKPSHSGTRVDFREWDVARLMAETPKGASHRGEMVAYLEDVFRRKKKPYLLVQPFLAALDWGEYRLFYINRQLRSALWTTWQHREKGEEHVVLKRLPFTNKAELKVMDVVGRRVVELLPRDSLLYRVDLFRRDEGDYAVNEVEMVDACLFPDDQSFPIVACLAEAIIAHRRTPEAPVQSSVDIAAPLPRVPELPATAVLNALLGRPT